MDERGYSDNTNAIKHNDNDDKQILPSWSFFLSECIASSSWAAKDCIYF